MSDIPDDIMKTAREVVDAVWAAWTDADEVEVVARAILAERERCAFVATATPHPRDKEHILVAAMDRSRAISAAILAGRP